MRSTLIATAAFLYASQAVAAGETIVKIAHVAPLSGAQAAFGKDNENGARMAIADLNAKGMKIGGKTVKFELVAEDDAADAKQGAAVAQKLCDMKVNGVVGHLNSGTTIPASKIYQGCGLPMVTPAATNPDLTKLGYANVFRLLASDSALGAGLADYAAKTLKAKRVAIIDDRTAYGQGIASVFKNTAKQKGLQIVAEDYTNDKAVDFLAILTSIKAKRPDVIFFGGMDPQAGPMLRQMAQLGMYNTKFMGGDGLCTEKLAEQAAKAPTLVNVYCGVGGAAVNKMPGGKAWKARYDAKYPGEYQIYSPYVYDATMVLADAMQRAGSADPKAYLPFIGKSNYQGISAHIQFDARGELLHPAISISTYKGNKKMPLN
ncbi:MAG: branched-chain amino acid ABC transporter substrate-binding protein [Brachymonas sp.]|jgi:branched-chain amino acid transport system substrate-binding protein